MSEERFYVRELLGYPINLTTTKRASTEKLSVYIMDRLYNCCVVETFEYDHPVGLDKRARMRRMAARRCAELNEAWRQELARGVVA